MSDQAEPVGKLAVHEERAGKGLRVAVTPAGAFDTPAIEAFVADLGAETRYLRFMHATRVLPPALLERMLVFDPPRGATLLGFPVDAAGELVGIAQYSETRERGVCEAAVVVGDRWQRQGIATFLLSELARVARFGGFRRASATMLSDNGPAIALARRWGATISIVPGNAQLTRVDVALDGVRLLRREPDRTIRRPPPLHRFGAQSRILPGR